MCVEECDALLRTRGDQTGSGHLFDRPLALFLQKIESLEAALKCPILWVATSNRPDLVDPASLRRIGMRTVTFGTLTAAEAAVVLAKKLPEACRSAPRRPRRRLARRPARQGAGLHLRPGARTGPGRGAVRQ